MEVEMKYQTKADLPETIRQVLPEEAQEAYLQAYARSWDTYSPSLQRTLDQDAITHRDAWEAVLKEFEQDPNTHLWHRHGEQPEAMPDEGGLLDKIKRVFAA
jgi:cation transport regulator